MTLNELFSMLSSLGSPQQAPAANQPPPMAAGQVAPAEQGPWQRFTSALPSAQGLMQALQKFNTVDPSKQVGNGQVVQGVRAGQIERALGDAPMPVPAEAMTGIPEAGGQGFFKGTVRQTISPQDAERIRQQLRR